MLRILSAISVVVVVALTAWGVLTLYDENLKIGRMWETPAIKPHEHPIPVMSAHVVPFGGGEGLYRQADAETLQPTLDIRSTSAIDAGKKGYERYCIHCHGKNHDGNGTVGQSFAPLPGDLRSGKIQTQSPGQIFYEISYGVPGGRQPALSTTISVEERWQIVGYVKSLGLR